MLVIENTIISENVVDIRFVCDLDCCNGHCCVEGDAGAPLEEEEVSILEDIIDIIKLYMSDKGAGVISKEGVFDYDSAGELVTPLINGKECAFTVFTNDGTAECAIEKAFDDKKISYPKPISCHLYPIRLTNLKDHQAVNYHKWYICHSALKKGEELDIPVYKFLEEPLIRKFSKQWYNALVKKIDSG